MFANKKEIKSVCNLLTDTISAEDFADSDVIESENGYLVLTFVERFSLTTEEIPKPYKMLFGNVCKIRVAGYMQISSAESLDFFAESFLKQLDIRHPEEGVSPGYVKSRRRKKPDGKAIPGIKPYFWGLVVKNQSIVSNSVISLLTPIF